MPNYTPMHNQSIEQAAADRASCTAFSEGVTPDSGGGFVYAQGSPQFVGATMGASAIVGLIGAGIRQQHKLENYDNCMVAHGYQKEQTQIASQPPTAVVSRSTSAPASGATSVNPHSQAATAAEQAANYQNMLREAQAWVSEDPNNAQAHYVLGTAYLRLNQWDYAAQSLRTALQINPSFAVAWNNLGVVQVSSGHREEASVYFHKAIELDPTFANPWAALGRIANYEGRHADVVAAYDMLLKLNPAMAQTFRQQFLPQSS
jgi:tetratricopeptide (TPR) repeat protein